MTEDDPYLNKLNLIHLRNIRRLLDVPGKWEEFLIHASEHRIDNRPLLNAQDIKSNVEFQINIKKESPTEKLFRELGMMGYRQSDLMYWANIEGKFKQIYDVLCTNKPNAVSRQRSEGGGTITVHKHESYRSGRSRSYGGGTITLGDNNFEQYGGGDVDSKLKKLNEDETKETSSQENDVFPEEDFAKGDSADVVKEVEKKEAENATQETYQTAPQPVPKLDIQKSGSPTGSVVQKGSQDSKETTEKVEHKILLEKGTRESEYRKRRTLPNSKETTTTEQAIKPSQSKPTIPYGTLSFILATATLLVFALYFI